MRTRRKRDIIASLKGIFAVIAAMATFLLALACLVALLRWVLG